MTLIYFTSAMIVLLGALKLFWHYYTRHFSHLPNPLGYNLPILGNWLAFPDLKSYVSVRSKWYKEWGDTHVLWLFYVPMVETRDPAIIEEVTSGMKHSDKDNTGFYLFEDWIGDGLFSSNGEKWRKRRKMITHAFHFDILKDYLTSIERNTKNMILELARRASEGSVFNVVEVTKPHALSVVCETAMGTELNAFDVKNSSEGVEFIKDNITLNNTLTYRMERPWLWTSWSFKLFKVGQEYCRALKASKAFLRKVIEARIKAREGTAQQNGKKQILTDVLLDAYERNEIDVEGIMEEVNAFMIAGFDTVANALAWCLYLLGRDQEKQEKAFTEAQQIDLEDLTMEEKLKEMKYIECVVKESLRLRPPGGVISRQLSSDITVNGVTIPKSVVVLDIMEMHRNEKLWENPWKFQPERFQELSKSQKHLFSYLPFSAGPRNCIGQRFAMIELKVALYYILLNFEITAVQEESDIVEVFDLSLASETGILLKLKTRLQ